MKKAGDIVSALFREKFGAEFMETARSNADLFSSWGRIVTEACPRSLGGGDNSAAAFHSGVRELDRGVLLVEADHPGWVQILQTRQAEILALVQRGYPELNISGIAFTLSRKPLSPEKKVSPE